MRNLTFLTAVAVALSPAAFADNLYVDKDNTSGQWDGRSWATAFVTIQAGIDAAVDGDEVIVEEGTYVENIHFNGKKIILRSVEPTDRDVAASTVIDGNQFDSVVTFSGAESFECVLSGFTITNGNAYYGGGIRGHNTLATIQYNTIAGNTSKQGGGLSGCRGTVQHNVVKGNSAELGGGFAWCPGTIKDNTIVGNSADGYGGGLYECDGTITNNTITGNSATGLLGNGGGLHECDGIITNNTITGNSATGSFGSGGGLHECDGTIRANMITGNRARRRGGGISGCDGAIQNNGILDNSAGFDGGGLYLCNGAIHNNTIASNISDSGAGGGIYCEDSSPVIVNNILLSNACHAIHVTGAQSNPEVRHCLFYNNPDGDYYDDGPLYTGAHAINANVAGASNNIDGDPLFRDGSSGTWTGDPTYDASTGWTTLVDSAASFTQGALVGMRINVDTSQSDRGVIVDNTATTVSVAGNLIHYAGSGDAYQVIDHHLQDDSPCIDAGTDTGAPSDDLDGELRPFDLESLGADDTGSEYDIGCDEYVPAGFDTDFDRLGDAWEIEHFGDLSHDADEDIDGDQLTNGQEFVHACNPNDCDTDGDVMPDGWEVANELDPLVNDALDDPDQDGITNFQEYGYGTDPHEVDTGILPTTPEVDVTPDTTPERPRTTHNLVCSVTSESTVSGRRTARYEYAWSNGSEAIVHGPKWYPQDTLDSWYTKKHETWTCSVRCWDAIAYSGPASDSTTIVNTPPSQPVLSFPTFENADTDLVCLVITPSADEDGDVISYMYDWYVRHVGETGFSDHEFADDGDRYSLVKDLFTVVGDVWYLTVTPSDGDDYGTEAVSNECTILSTSGTAPSSITCFVDPQTVQLGKSITISGTIVGTAGRGTFVGFTSKLPSGLALSNFPEGVVVPHLVNSYSRMFYPTEASEGKNPWEVIASWPGDDIYRSSASRPAEFTVTKAQPTLSLELSASSVPVGLGGTRELTATATFVAPVPPTSLDLVSLQGGRTIELYWRDPNRNTPEPDEAIEVETVLGTTTAGTKVGIARFDLLSSGINFDNADTCAGTWEFQANFDEDDNFLRATSPGYDDDDAVRLIVKNGAGYAIIVLGRIDLHSEGHREHAKTTDFVYGVLRDRGFAHEDIYYLRELLEGEEAGANTEVDDTPTRESIQYAIEQWAFARMTERTAPLYVVWVDHGSVNRFCLYSTSGGEGYVTAQQLASYFHTLQSDLVLADDDAAGQDIVFVYGACHSGSFVPVVTGEHRTIIASCGANEISHRGVADMDDGIRDGEVFVTELFREVSLGKTLKDSFRSAAEQVAEYTATRSNSAQADWPQHALLDDPGCRAGQLVLGFGSNAGRSVGWQYATPKTIGPDEPIDVLEARADRDYLTEEYQAWVEVKTPLYDGGEPADDDYDEFQRVVAMSRVNYSPEISNLDTGIFRWAASTLIAEVDFSHPGTYKVFYYITDPETCETSTYLLTTIYRGQQDNEAPLPVTLVYPENGAVMGKTPVFVWEETTDPDGHALTYRLELAEDSDFTVGVIVVERLTSTSAVVSDADGLMNNRTYHWRVIPVDQYGAAPGNNTPRTFTTDFQNEDARGAIVGLITDARTGDPIADATVTVSDVPGTVFSSDRGNYVFANLAPSDSEPTNLYTVQVSADGYEKDTATSVYVPAGDVAEVNFALMLLVKDSDGDGILDEEEGTDDPDDDGLPNYLDTDSDDDELPDADEGTSDPDSDGLPNYLDADSDDDGMPDGWEVQNGLDPVTDDGDGDVDADGLSNTDEHVYRCDPNNSDTDNDGLSDGDEVSQYGTDPANSDTDGDRLSDAEEISEYDTDPLEHDTDGDGAWDGREVDAGTDPLDKDDKPPFEFGDVNGDGNVDALDVQLVINEALGIHTGYDCDLNGDESVNAIDVQLVINTALGMDVSEQV